MTTRRALFFLPILIILSALLPAQVRVGADVLLEQELSLIRGKRVGLITNHTALLADGRHLADALAALPDVKLTALFGPEHGVRGDAADGATIQNGKDSKTGVPVYSLYGRVTKPTDEMLKNVDVLLYDIQDVGVRFYTFESTLILGMEAAAEHHIPYVVLDRPNPLGGMRVEGPLRVDSLRSFVGWLPVPIAHGMTVGELAMMANDEGWLEHGVKADLRVVRMEGWKRTMWYDETGLRWVRPSPNMATLNTAIVYPGTCLVEGITVAEGRGTERPFEWLGAPFIDGDLWAHALNRLALPGVRFEPIAFIPKEIPGVASNPKFRDRHCAGVFVDVIDRNVFEAVRTGITILSTARALYPDSVQWRGSIDRLAGTTEVRLAIDQGVDADSLCARWKPEIERFRALRQKYLLY